MLGNSKVQFLKSFHNEFKGEDGKMIPYFKVLVVDLEENDTVECKMKEEDYIRLKLDDEKVQLAFRSAPIVKIEYSLISQYDPKTKIRNKVQFIRNIQIVGDVKG